MGKATVNIRNAQRSRTLGPLLVAAVLLFGITPARSQSSGSASAGWTYEVTPYLWGSGLEGDVQAGALPKTSTDMSFSDIFDVLDFAAMGTFEARRDRWGFLFDLIYLELSDSGTATQTGPGPIGATLTATADVTVKQAMLTGAVAYRVSEGRSPVDVIGGLRYTKTEVDADIGASLFGPLGAGVASTVSRSGDEDWVDLLVGLRVQHPIADRWTLVGYADVGGFGLGSSSELTWQAIGGANYEYSKRVSIKFGYRYMSIDYDNGGALYDMIMQGPYVGVGIRF